MKKVLLFALAIFAFGTTIQAQENDASMGGGGGYSAPSLASGGSTEYKGSQGSVTFDFKAGKNDLFGFGYDMSFSWINLGYNYLTNEHDDVTTTTWDIHLGLHRRYWFNDRFFVEGNVGFAYFGYAAEYESKRWVEGYSGKYYSRPGYYKTETAEWDDGYFGMYIAPRIGFRLAKKWTINIGYNFDLPDFDSDMDRNYFSIGTGFCW